MPKYATHILLLLFAITGISCCVHPGAPGHQGGTHTAPRYPSYQGFIDSLVGQAPVQFSKAPCTSRTDTFGMDGQRCRVVDLAGNFQLHKYFFGIGSAHAVVAGTDSCFAALHYGKRIWESTDLSCWMDIDCADQGEFGYEGVRYLYCIASATENCIGSWCRVVQYPVIAITPTDTSLYVFSHGDDVTGLRFGDFNHDHYLDFLEVHHGFDQEIVATLMARDSTFTCQPCNNSQCYTIQVRSFVNGQWRLLKNLQGETYYLLIRLDTPLDPNGGFELIRSFWM